MFLVGALGSATLIWPFIWAVSTGDILLVFVFGILLSGIVYPAYGGVGFAMFAEQFDTRVRMSGVAVGTQFGFALGGFAPSIAAVLAGPTLSNWVPVAMFGCAASLVATVAALSMRETYRTPCTTSADPHRGRRPTPTPRKGRSPCSTPTSPGCCRPCRTTANPAFPGRHRRRGAPPRRPRAGPLLPARADGR